MFDNLSQPAQLGVFMADHSLVQKIVDSIAFLNSQGYIVKKGRSSSPQLKKAKK